MSSLLRFVDSTFPGSSPWTRDLSTNIIPTEICRLRFVYWTFPGSPPQGLISSPGTNIIPTEICRLDISRESTPQKRSHAWVKPSEVQKLSTEIVRTPIVAIFYPFSQFCEINISLLSLQKQPNTAPNLFQRGVEYGKYDPPPRLTRPSPAPFGSSGMGCLRMWGLKIIFHWPSNTEGVGTSHLKLITGEGLKTSILKPRILKHHIPEHPTQAAQRSVPAKSSQRRW